MAKVISFWSVDGGVGKTTLTTNLALMTALKNPTKKVVLIDFNLFNADVHYHLGIDESKIALPLEAFAMKEINFNNIEMQLMRYQNINNLWYLPGLADLNNFEKLRIYNFDMIIEYLKSSDKYDYIFIDMDSALNVDATFSAINKCDLLCVVGEPTYVSIKNILKVMDTVIKKVMTNNNVIYIFNKMSKELVAKSDIDYVFGVENVFPIDYNKQFPVSLNNQETIVFKNTRELKNVKKQLDAIVNRICKEDIE